MAIEFLWPGLQITGQANGRIPRHRTADKLVLIARMTFHIEDVQGRLGGVVHQETVTVVLRDDFAGLGLHLQFVCDKSRPLRAYFHLVSS